MDNEIKNTRTGRKVKLLKINVQKTEKAFSLRQLATFGLAFAIIGGYFLWHSYAAPAPQSAKAQAISGELEVWHSDDFKLNKKGIQSKNPKDWKSQTTYDLVTDDGKKYHLEFPGEGPDLLTGSKITVKGEKIGNSIKLTSPKAELNVNYKALPKHSPRKTAVILINWQDDPDEPAGVDQVKRSVFTADGNDASGVASVNHYFQETSYGFRSLVGKNDTEGDVFGYFTVPASSSGNCDASYGIWMLQAKQMATDQGIDLNGYDNYIYAWPWRGCGFSGKALIGGNTSEINGIYPIGLSTNVVAHEMGHNFGVDHANGLECYDSSGLPVSISSNCEQLEYQDPYDVMGNSSYRQMSAVHKAALGWLPQTNIQSISSSGEFTISPLEYTMNGTQMLKVVVPTKGRGSAVNYCVELRQPYGKIDNFSPEEWAVNGVIIRQTYNCDGAARTWLVDTTPSTADNWLTEQLNSPLPVGRTFTDKTYGISITTQSISPDGATVKVVFSKNIATNDALCSNTNLPTAVKPGSTFNANFSLENTGNNPWTTADYKLRSIKIEPRWQGSTDKYLLFADDTWGLNSLDLSSEVPARGKTNISGSLSAPDQTGVYQFNWRMYQQSAEEYFGVSCQAIINVNDDTTPPSVPANLQASSNSKSTIGLNWGASSDNKGVKGYKVYRLFKSGKGKNATSSYNLIGYSFTTSYTDNGLSSGTSYSYQVTAYDDAENESPKSNTASAAAL